MKKTRELTRDKRIGKDSMDSRKRTEDMVLDVVKDVKVIKAAILKSRYIAARLANGEMLKLYFAIGGYVS